MRPPSSPSWAMSVAVIISPGPNGLFCFAILLLLRGPTSYVLSGRFESKKTCPRQRDVECAVWRGGPFKTEVGSADTEIERTEVM